LAEVSQKSSFSSAGMLLALSVGSDLGLQCQIKQSLAIRLSGDYPLKASKQG
jgi:hypothetical protein